MDFSSGDAPVGSVDAFHGLLAAGGPARPERMIAARIQDVSHAPFYNITVGGKPVEKTFVLLQFTQTTKGAQRDRAFRIVADNVIDGGTHGGAAEHKVSTIARCSVERCPGFTAQKNMHALAVVCKITAPTKAQHVADVYIDATQIVDPAHLDRACAVVSRMRVVAVAFFADATPSQESAYAQQKCRGLHRYSTEA